MSLKKIFANFITCQFHKLYYNSYKQEGTWKNTFWLGIKTQKCPLDTWIYQEILHEIKPDFIIECGTNDGGSALYLASICDLLNHGQIITIDITDRPNRPKHQRITYLLGSSVSDEIINKVKDIIKNGRKILVILDSDHSKNHVLKEMNAYHSLVSVGSYLIVEDTNLNGHPIKPFSGPGPMEALKEFLEHNQNFIIDDTKEKFYMTFNPKGYLKKTK